MIKRHLLVNICALALLVCISGCGIGDFFDALQEINEERRSDQVRQPTHDFSTMTAEDMAALSAEEERRDVVRRRSEIVVLRVFRPDYYAVLLDGQTQTVHLAGVVAPDAQLSAHTHRFAEVFGLPSSHLPTVIREAIPLLEELVFSQPLILEYTTTRTGDTDTDIIRGEILLPDTQYLSERVVSRGFAHVYQPTREAAWRLERAEMDARINERGIWYNPVPIERRFRIRSDFDLIAYSTSREEMRSSDGQRVLERYLSQDVQGVIHVGIAAIGAMTRPYTGSVTYAFVQREEHGTRRQEHLPRQQDGAGAHGEHVYEDSRVGGGTLPFVLTTSTTNLVFESPIETVTRTQKGAQMYVQGITYVGYDLTVHVGTNRVYRHRHYF